MSPGISSGDDTYPMDDRRRPSNSDILSRVAAIDAELAAVRAEVGALIKEVSLLAGTKRDIELLHEDVKKLKFVFAVDSPADWRRLEHEANIVRVSKTICQRVGWSGIMVFVALFGWIILSELDKLKHLLGLTR